MPMSRAERAVLLENEFQSAGVPTVDGLRLAEQVRQAFAELDIAGANLENFECRAGVCRASFVFDSAEVDRKVIFELFVKSKVDGRAFSIPKRVRTSDGRIRATLYLFDPADPDSLSTDEE